MMWEYSRNPNVILLALFVATFLLLKSFMAKTLVTRLFRLSFLTPLFAYLVLITEENVVPFSVKTLTQSALNGLCVIKVCSFLLFYDGGDEVSLWSYLKQILWMMFPIQYIEKEKRMSLFQSMQYALMTISCIFLKVTTLNVVEEWLLMCLPSETLPLPYVTSIQYCFAFFIYICCCNSTSDFLVALAPVVTLGQYEVVPFNNFPFVSTSPREFWSKRYNLIVRTFLHTSVFSPLQTRGFSAASASFASFFVSGLLHVYCAETTFRTGGLSTMCFFLLHGLLCLVPGPRRGSSVFVTLTAIIITLIVVSVLAPLYLGLFLSQGTKYLTVNPRDKELLAEWVPSLHAPSNMCPIRF